MGPVEFLSIAALIAINGFFVAAEFALVKVRVSQIDQLAEKGSWSAKLTSRALDHLDAYLSASQLGITVASLALGRMIEEHVEPMISQGLLAVGLPGGTVGSGALAISVVPLIALSLVTLLHMALGEQAPKSLAIRSPRLVSLWTAPPLIAFYYVFWPIIQVLNFASNATLWAVGLGKTDHAEMTHTEEELRHIVAESVAGGHLSRRERMMIENVLNLEEKTARRVMVPRPDIVYLSLSRPLEDNLRIARQAGHTRYPLCEDDLTSVIGMIHVKDLFRAGNAVNTRPDLRKWARKIPYLIDSIRLDQLLVEFQRDRIHLAMLVDEYGGLVGMVSMEDVLEEVVGPIQDEFDREAPQVTPADDGTFEVDASCPLDVLAAECGVELPEEVDSETVGGLVLEELGRLAQVGDAVTVGTHRLIVLRADPTRIRRVKVEPIAPRPPAAEAPGP